MYVRILLVSFICLLSMDICLGQELISMNKRMVISTNGVHLREKANNTSRILVSLPFGELVTMLDESQGPADTIGTSQVFGRNATVVTNSITGHWAHVSYNGLIGYVFDPFLVYPEKIETFEDPDYLLLFPYCSCNFNFHKTRNHFWYGVFQLDTMHFRITEIEPQYWVDRGNRMMPYCISANEIQDLRFMIGTKKKLTTKVIKGNNDRDYYDTSFDPINEINKSFSYDHATAQLTFYRKGIVQIIDPADKNQGEERATRIVWRGDVDGDQEDDFIIRFGEKSGQDVLFLSSHPPQNQALRAVAAYFISYCC